MQSTYPRNIQVYREQVCRSERDAFVSGFLECATWASLVLSVPEDPEERAEMLAEVRDDDPELADALADLHSDSTGDDSGFELSAESRARLMRRALRFLRSNARALVLASRSCGWDYLGHSAFLTQEGHGAGFWDGRISPQRLGSILTRAAKDDQHSTHFYLERQTDEDGAGEIVLVYVEG